MQTYVLIVQNAILRGDLGIATSITQLTHSMGATFGTGMVSRMKTEIPKHVHPEALTVRRPVNSRVEAG